MALISPNGDDNGLVCCAFPSQHLERVKRIVFLSLRTPIHVVAPQWKLHDPNSGAQFHCRRKSLCFNYPELFPLFFFSDTILIRSHIQTRLHNRHLSANIRATASAPLSSKGMACRMQNTQTQAHTDAGRRRRTHTPTHLPTHTHTHTGMHRHTDTPTHLNRARLLHRIRGQRMPPSRFDAATAKLGQQSFAARALSGARSMRAFAHSCCVDKRTVVCLLQSIS